MSYSYQVSISEDFPNQKVHSISLKTAVDALELESATLQYINTDGDDCFLVFDIEPSSEDITAIDGVIDAHTGNPSPVVVWHASSVLAESEKSTSDTDPNWTELGGSVTTPNFFTPNVAACLGRVVGMVKTNGTGAKLRLREGEVIPTGGYNVPDTEGEWTAMQWFAPDHPTAGTHSYALEGQLPTSGATELKVKYVAVSLLEFT
jgi:hypothetical protein